DDILAAARQRDAAEQARADDSGPSGSEEEEEGPIRPGLMMLDSEDEDDVPVASRTRSRAGPRQYHVPSGALAEMVANMSDDWASSEDELNFAEESDNEDIGTPLPFAESTIAEHNDSGSLEFAESSAIETDSDKEVATSEKTSSGLEFAESSAVESEEELAATSSKTSSELEFAESSAVESEEELATTSSKTSSGLEFAESSAVDSDSAKEHGSSSGLGWAESSDYD
ncbi:hypothetical protein N9A45_02235, partial [bacterium]|nr:hypothetical protein [bacterium]